MEESTESLRAALHEGIDRSFPWSECWVVAELSHPAFCSGRDLTTCAAMSSGHALEVVERLTVRMQRVHIQCQCHDLLCAMVALEFWQLEFVGQQYGR